MPAGLARLVEDQLPIGHVEPAGSRTTYSILCYICCITMLCYTRLSDMFNMSYIIS